MDKNMMNKKFAATIGLAYVFGILDCCESIDDACVLFCMGGEL